jgi:hypothetical protein
MAGPPLRPAKRHWQASANWSIEQRVRLHAALSRAYAADHQDAKAGEQAVQTALLEPVNERLVSASVICLVNARRPWPASCW